MVYSALKAKHGDGMHYKLCVLSHHPENSVALLNWANPIVNLPMLVLFVRSCSQHPTNMYQHCEQLQTKCTSIGGL